MIPADIRNGNNILDFTMKVKSWLPNACPCNLCHPYTCKVGCINN